MRQIDVAGATHLFKKPENWREDLYGPCIDLAARVKVDTENVDERGHGLVTVTVAWMPTPEERRQIAAGAVLELVFCTNGVPPHRLDVVETIPAVAVPHGDPAISINEEAHGLGYDEHGPATP
jgi:hypothetical protein